MVHTGHTSIKKCILVHKRLQNAYTDDFFFSSWNVAWVSYSLECINHLFNFSITLNAKFI